MRWTRLAPLGLLLAFAAPAHADPEVVLPSERCRGLWIVPLTAGDATLELVLDTGAARTSIDPDSLERALGRRVRPGKRATLKRTTIGELRIGRLRARSHDLDHIGRALGRPIDGILGIDTFDDVLLTLDYPAGEVRVAEGTLEATDGAVRLRDIGKTRPWIELAVGERRVSVLIDSGFTGGLTLREEDVSAWRVPPRPLSGSVRYSRIAVKPAGRADVDARFGPFTIARPVVDLSSGSRLIGAETLATLSLTFDRRARRIAIAGAPDEPVRHAPMRGLGAVIRPRAEGHELVRVFDDTPASRAGLRAGDLVLAYGGVPVYEAGCEGTARRYEAERLALDVEREGERLAVEVELGVLVP